MSKRKYPPLEAREVREILRALGFSKKSHDGTAHEQWERPAGNGRMRAVVTVDENYSPFNDYLLKSMIAQSGFSREQFYGATNGTARKCGVKLFEVASD